MKNYCIFSALMAALVLPMMANATDVDRHVYNMTGDVYYFAIAADKGGVSTDCPEATTRGDGTVECFIQPNATITVTYSTSEQLGMQNAHGAITFADKDKIVKTWKWDFGQATSFNSPHIFHQGSTNGLNLNTPSDGDVQLYGPLVQ